jgi:hypothetical protein
MRQSVNSAWFNTSILYAGETGFILLEKEASDFYSFAPVDSKLAKVF